MLKKKILKIVIKQQTNNIILQNVKYNNTAKCYCKNKRFALKNIFLIKHNESVLLKGDLNVCSVTGKYKTIFNSLKLSRHVIKNFCDNDCMANFSKISW